MSIWIQLTYIFTMAVQYNFNKPLGQIYISLLQSLKEVDEYISQGINQGEYK